MILKTTFFCKVNRLLYTFTRYRQDASYLNRRAVFADKFKRASSFIWFSMLNPMPAKIYCGKYDLGWAPKQKVWLGCGDRTCLGVPLLSDWVTDCLESKFYSYKFESFTSFVYRFDAFIKMISIENQENQVRLSIYLFVIEEGYFSSTNISEIFMSEFWKV